MRWVRCSFAEFDAHSPPLVAHALLVQQTRCSIAHSTCLWEFCIASLKCVITIESFVHAYHKYITASHTPLLPTSSDYTLSSVSSFSFSYYSHSLLSTCAYISTGNSLRITFFDYRKCTSIQIIAFSTLKLWQSFWKKTYKHLAGTRVEPAPNSEYALITCKYGIMVTCSPKSMQAIYWCLQVAWHMMITIIA